MGDRSVADVSPNAAGDGADALNLARRPDIAVGRAALRPSLRLIEGPGGSVTLEPRVMQVLLVLKDAGGAVRTREDLFQSCWPRVVVGDDSLNRAIAEARRAARSVDAGFVIETIPRVGYRLVVEPSAEAAESPPPADAGAPITRARPSRRLMLLGGAAAVGTAVAGVGFLGSRRKAEEVRQLLDRGQAALKDALPRRDREAATLFRQAVDQDPGHAASWGWLALAALRVATRSPPSQAQDFFDQSEEAVARALALDPREPNARATAVEAHQQLEGYLTNEDRLRAILADTPDNLAALDCITAVTQSVGRCRESLQFNERAIAAEPFAVVPQHRRALKHWIFGNNHLADGVIDGALRRWPRHPLLWHGRVITYAFSGRPAAALAVVEDAASRPVEETAQSLALWRASLTALGTRAPADVRAARVLNETAAPNSPLAAVNAIMILAALGEVDSAYDVAEGFLLRRGRLVGRPVTTAGAALARRPEWQRTQWLFTPVAASLRQSPRYQGFCRDIGLADYWRRRGVGPDF